MNAEATMRILREVTVLTDVGHELLVLSTEPAAAGDVFMLDAMANDATVSSQVYCVDSRLVLVNGSVRHRLRLKRTNGVRVTHERPRSATKQPTRSR
jgi:hypothetical protein